MFDVITVGSATKDIFLRTEESKIMKEKVSHHDFICFNYGSKIDIESFFVQTGGAATNAAVAFARLGLKTAILAKIGEDEAGEIIEHILRKERVNTDLMLKDKKLGTALSVVISAMRGDRTIFTYRGASANMHKEEIPLNQIKARWLYISALARASEDMLPHLLEYAKKEKIKVALNPGASQLKERKKLIPLLKKVKVLILNKEECEKLIGKALSTEKDFADAFKEIRSFGPGVIVITDGTYLMRVYENDHILIAEPYNVKVANNLGAGDAFGAAFVSVLIEKGSVLKALERGALNASSVIQHVGAKVGLLRKSQIANYEKVLRKKLKVRVTHLDIEP